MGLRSRKVYGRTSRLRKGQMEHSRFPYDENAGKFLVTSRVLTTSDDKEFVYTDVVDAIDATDAAETMESYLMDQYPGIAILDTQVEEL